MFLSEEAIKKIHKDTLEILETTGVRIYCKEALELLGSAGCRIDGTLVKIPSSLVEDAIAQAPSKWTIYDREGKEALYLGDDKTYYGTADVVPFFDDTSTGERRPFRVDDSRKAVTLIDALPNIDFVSPFGVPRDVPPEVAEIHAFEAAVNCTTKPIAFVVPDVKNLSSVIEIASAIKGDEEMLRKEPFVFLILEPSPPLMFATEAVEKILWLAERRIPFFIGGCPELGATAPVTIAGALVQSNVEMLAGLVIAQLKRKGAPVGIGTCTGVMDMSTGTYVMAAPEHALGIAGYSELVKYYDLPSWGNGCQSNSKSADEQAAIEAFSTCFTAALAGVNVVYDAGYLESGKTSSLEMVVMVDEMVGMVRRILRGIEVNEGTLAKDVIKKVGPGGNFLAEEHTLEHFKKELWFPTLMDRQDYEKWRMSGKLTMRDRIAKKIKHLLETHKPKPLSREVEEEVRKIKEKG